MAARTLVISNPPHGAVKGPMAAPVLGLIPVEFNLKAHYPVPEIWLAEEDPEAGIHAAEILGEAGANVVVTSSDALAAVPARQQILKFAFGDAGMRVLVGRAPAEIPYAYPIMGVYCVPKLPTGGSPVHETDAQGAHAPLDAVFLDLYLKTASGVTRLSIDPQLVDFSGLGASRVPSQARNLAQLMERMEERFTGLRVDRRLVNMQIRRRVGGGTPAATPNNRRGYSFASPGLNDLLQAVAPALLDACQSDLSSRLVYLTLR